MVSSLAQLLLMCPFVKTVVRLLLIVCALTPFLSEAKDDLVVQSIPGDQAMCPISMELNSMEKDAYIDFHVRLSSLRNHFGKDSFGVKLSSALEEQWPTAKVIETSPLFVEKVLNKVEQQYLMHAVASTIGLDHPSWDAFSRVMRRVTLNFHSPGMTENAHGLFSKKTEKLMAAIRDVPLKKMKTKKITEEDAAILKGRALSMIANMYIYLEQQSLINQEIIHLRAQAAKAKFFFNMVRYGSVALLVASTMYAGPILAMASLAARGLVADAVIAAQMAKLGHVVGGATLGAVGSPLGHAFISSSGAMYEAKNNSLNNGTVYACELNKKFEEWRRRGASPYLKAAVIGGGVGIAGGAMTLSKTGAQVVLFAATSSVGIGQTYALYGINDNSMRGIAEYKMAVIAQDSGDNELARAHLRKSRDYFQVADQKKMEALVIGILSMSFAAGDLKAALTQGEDMIRVVFANSADTLPQAIQSAAEFSSSFAGQVE